jgi:hypothetical protein
MGVSKVFGSAKFDIKQDVRPESFGVLSRGGGGGETCSHVRGTPTSLVFNLGQNPCTLLQLQMVIKEVLHNFRLAIKTQSIKLMIGSVRSCHLLYLHKLSCFFVSLSM